MGIADKMHERETIPPIHVLNDPEASIRWTDEWLALFKKREAQRRDVSLVRFHQERLGQQTCCWMGGSRRYYVWDRPGWRIYVHREGGVSFELPAGTTPTQVWESLKEYEGALLGEPGRGSPRSATRGSDG